MKSGRPNPYLESALIAAITVGVAAILSKPALRQAIVMRVTLTAHRICRAQAEFWSTAAANTATAYQRARL